MIKILIPVDGSELALDAVRHVMRLAREGLRVSAVLANVQEPSSLYEIVVAHDPEVLERVSREAGEHALATATVLLEEADLPFEPEIAVGDPASALVDIVERFGCDAVVIGARGSSDLGDVLLGRVSQWVLQHSPVPVTIVHRAASEPEFEDETA